MQADALVSRIEKQDAGAIAARARAERRKADEGRVVELAATVERLRPLVEALAVLGTS
jgi:hypothetical protein